MLLTGNRQIVPEILQNNIVYIAHEGHRGIVKTKQLLCEKVWFTGIDSLVDKCRVCILCQAATSKNHIKEPLQMTDLPKKKWVQVSVDHCGPYPNGKQLLVIIDDYSGIQLWKWSLLHLQVQP